MHATSVERSPVASSVVLLPSGVLLPSTGFAIRQNGRTTIFRTVFVTHDIASMDRVRWSRKNNEDHAEPIRHRSMSSTRDDHQVGIVVGPNAATQSLIRIDDGRELLLLGFDDDHFRLLQISLGQ